MSTAGRPGDNKNLCVASARDGTIATPLLDLSVTMGCGQVFGWAEYDESYFGIIDHAGVSLKQVGATVRFATDGAINASRVRHYLALDDDLEAILDSVRVDPFMRRVLGAVKGLRLLKQDPWHCLCSYLISSNNRVERIDRSVKEIARKWGTRHTVRCREVFDLPGANNLARCAERGIRSCGVGFRAPYLRETARDVAAGRVDLDRIGRLPYDDAKQALLDLRGVGDKIADCVLLFAYSKFEAFPVDVWIKRAVEKIYFRSRSLTTRDIHQFAREHFGPYAGYAQEYIYHFARIHGLD